MPHNFLSSKLSDFDFQIVVWAVNIDFYNRVINFLKVHSVYVCC